MKYIMIQRGNQVLPIIFPDYLVHDDVAKAIIALLERQDGPKLQPRKAVAAGEVIIFDAKCEGKSESLGLKSRGSIDSFSIKLGHYAGYYE
jgi:hypothetical protein